MQGPKGRTLSVNPQQGTGIFPISEYAAFGEPHCGASVMSIARKVVIYGRIRRTKPFQEVLFRPVPCRWLVGSYLRTTDASSSNVLYGVAYVLNIHCCITFLRVFDFVIDTMRSFPNFRSHSVEVVCRLSSCVLNT
jgi:hypothetical protein